MLEKKENFPNADIDLRSSFNLILGNSLYEGDNYYCFLKNKAQAEYVGLFAFSNMNRSDQIVKKYGNQQLIIKHRGVLLQRGNQVGWVFVDDGYAVPSRVKLRQPSIVDAFLDGNDVVVIKKDTDGFHLYIIDCGTGSLYRLNPSKTNILPGASNFTYHKGTLTYLTLEGMTHKLIITDIAD